MKLLNIPDFITIGLMALVFILLLNYALRKTGLDAFTIGNAAAAA